MIVLSLLKNIFIAYWLIGIGITLHVVQSSFYYTAGFYYYGRSETDYSEIFIILPIAFGMLLLSLTYPLSIFLPNKKQPNKKE